MMKWLKTKPKYFKDDSFFEGDEWYDHCCYLTIKNEPSWGCVPGGCVSNSGDGDGRYDVLAAYDGDKIVTIKIIF